MAIETLRIDGDDVSELISDVEASFDIGLGRDLRHIVTVGDLHRAIMEQIDYDGGESCPTSRTFYALRRALSESGVPRDARPDFRFGGAVSSSPAALRRALADRTGLVMPPLTLSWLSCVLLLAGVVAAIASWWWSGWLVLPIFIAAICATRLDRGGFRGSWSSLETLARSVAGRNHSTLARSGTRQSASTVWHALVALLCDLGIDREKIGPGSRLCA